MECSISISVSPANAGCGRVTITTGKEVLLDKCFGHLKVEQTKGKGEPISFKMNSFIPNPPTVKYIMDIEV